MTVQVRKIKTFRLSGTIDGHDPIGVTLRVTGGIEPFRITFVTVNWGREYEPGEFKRNVMRVLNKVGEREYVILLIQELDEADAAKEHVILAGVMEPGTTLVRWETREPIAVSPGVPVKRKRAVMTMDQGTAFGGPEGTGPRRMFVSCIIVIQGVIIGVGNQHPHRYSIKHQKVAEARNQGEEVTRKELKLLAGLCDFVVWGGDVNTRTYPKMHPNERTLVQKNYDIIRLIKEKKNG